MNGMTIALSVAVLVLLVALVTGWLVLRRTTARLTAFDQHVERGKAALAEVVQREVTARETELEQILVRTRADALSKLADE
jgi:cytochrome b